MKRFAVYRTLFLALAPVVSGCAAMQVTMEYKDLDVQTQMSATIFLEPVPAPKKTVWIDAKNTSDQELDLAPITSLITGRGYRVVTDPDQANYRLQLNILYVGSASTAAIRDSLYAGWGGTLAGATAGSMAGAGISRSPIGVGIGTGVGGLVGGAAELIAGSLVKKVVFSMITDVQIGERSDKPVSQTQTANVSQGTATTVAQSVSEVSGWRLYRTRIASTATKVNLEFGEARSELTKRLLRSIAGIM